MNRRCPLGARGAGGCLISLAVLQGSRRYEHAEEGGRPLTTAERTGALCGPSPPSSADQSVAPQPGRHTAVVQTAPAGGASMAVTGVLVVAGVGFEPT